MCSLVLFRIDDFVLTKFVLILLAEPGEVCHPCGRHLVAEESVDPAQARDSPEVLQEVWLPPGHPPDRRRAAWT